MDAPERPYSQAREELRRAIADLRGDTLTPMRAALAVALGLFVGSLPIFGLHTAIVLALCLWLRLDGALGWLASNISNPFFAPFLMTFEVGVGRRLRTGQAPFDEADAARLREGFELDPKGTLLSVATDMFLGAPLTALGIALFGGLLTFVAVHGKRRFFPSSGARPPYRLPTNAPPWVRAVEEVATAATPGPLSEPLQRLRFHRVRLSLLGDELLRKVVEIASGSSPLGTVLLACPRAETRGPLLVALGYAQKIAVFSSSHDEPLPRVDGALLLDALDELAPSEQEALLDKAVRSLSGSGRLIVAERGAGRALTRLVRRLGRALRGLAPPVSVEARVTWFRGKGLLCEVLREEEASPFVLLVAKHGSVTGSS